MRVVSLSRRFRALSLRSGLIRRPAALAAPVLCSTPLSTVVDTERSRQTGVTTAGGRSNRGVALFSSPKNGFVTNSCRARHSALSAAASGSAAADPGSARTPKQRRRRLDDIVCELHPEYSKNVVQSFIIQGKVLVEGQQVTKAGAQVKGGLKVELIAEVPKYVCRAGVKLEAAFRKWDIDVAGKVALDAGLSTGGFTDCLLQEGAARVYGVDVGRGQVAEKLRQDGRLIPMEKFNLRHLTAADLPEAVDIVTLDLSFISVLKVLPAVCEVLKPGGQMVVLVKPQFEAGKDKVSSGGVVKDATVRQEVVDGVVAGVEAAGFEGHGLIESPIKGAVGGNTEYLALFTRR